MSLQYAKLNIACFKSYYMKYNKQNCKRFSTYTDLKKTNLTKQEEKVMCYLSSFITLINWVSFSALTHKEGYTILILIFKVEKSKIDL